MESTEMSPKEASHDGESSNKENVPEISSRRVGILLTSLTSACFLLMLDSSIVSTAVPKITDEFNSLRDVGWYGSAYQLGSSVLQPMTGRIYDLFSLKWSFLAFFTFFELGSVICGAAQSSAMLIAGRAVAGIGAAGLINGAMIIVSSVVPLERRPFLTGIIMAVAQVGVASGPLVGGAFTTGYTWRWCFYVNLPFAVIVAVPLVLMHIPEQIEKKPPMTVLTTLHRQVDLVGFILVGPAVVQLLLALQFGGNQYGWKSSQVIGLFCGSGVTFIVWLFWNYHKGDEALLPVRIIKRTPIWTSGVYYAFLMSNLFGASYFLPIYFQAVKGVNAVMSGVYLLPTILPQLVAVILGGALVTRLGRVSPFAIFSATLTTIGSGLFSLFQPGTSTGKWVGYQILTGFGRGVGFQMPLVAVQWATSPEELATAMTYLVWCQYTGPAIFLTLYNTIFDTSLGSQLRQHAPGVNENMVLLAGATKFRKIVSPADLPGVLQAYSNSIDRVFYLAAGVAFVAWCAAWGMGWKDIRPKQKAVSNESTDQKESQDEPSVKV